MADGGSANVRGVPWLGVGLVIAVFAAMAVTIAVRTPPWEANDELGHVQNAQTLLDHRWYEMEPGGGTEAHQAPLYYLALAAWQRVNGLPATETPPPRLNPALPLCARGCLLHDSPREASDRALVLRLRLFNVALGAITILLTAMVAHRLSPDPWTPVLAAAFVASVPRFLFVSSVVNNDNLVNLLAAALTLASVVHLRTGAATLRQGLPSALAMGGLTGLLLMTKLTSITIGLAVAVALLVGARRWGTRIALGLASLAAALVASSAWLLSNQRRYGDPLAVSASNDYFRATGRFTLGLEGGPVPSVLFSAIPRNLWSSLWYVSGWNQFSWSAWAYLPLWGLLVVALSGLVARRPPIAQLAVLVAFVASGVISIVPVALNPATFTTFQGRLAFIGLPALGCLVAIGLERWKLALMRFIVPVAGLIGCIVAVRVHVIGVY